MANSNSFPPDECVITVDYGRDGRKRYDVTIERGNADYVVTFELTEQERMTLAAMLDNDLHGTCRFQDYSR